MSDTSAAHEFTIVRRGYDREQVDGHLVRLTSERDEALARISLLEKRVEELQRQTRDGGTGGPAIPGSGS